MEYWIEIMSPDGSKVFNGCVWDLKYFLYLTERLPQHAIIRIVEHDNSLPVVHPSLEDKPIIPRGGYSKQEITGTSPEREHLGTSEPANSAAAEPTDSDIAFYYDKQDSNAIYKTARHFYNLGMEKGEKKGYTKGVMKTMALTETLGVIVALDTAQKGAEATIKEVLDKDRVEQIKAAEERGKREGIKSLRNQISICEWALANVHTHSDKEFHHNCITCLFDEAEGKLAAIRRGEKNGE